MTISDWLAEPALWGFLGGLIFVSLRLTACVYDQDPTHGPVSRCFAEAFVALIVGTIAAAAFEPWLGSYIFHTPQIQETRAMAAVIGLLANQTAPGVITFLSETVLNRIKGGH